MQITFESYEEMMKFVQRIQGQTKEDNKKAEEKAPTYVTGAATAPVQQQPPAQQQAPIQQTVPAQQQVPVQQIGVPTSERTYTIDELAAAAMPLVDKGMQAQLQGLLAQFGVEALPMLPPAQYGSFATALRGMGAQI